MLGTDLCRTLREEMGWEGLLMIQSANDSSRDIAEYLEAGADGGIGKGLRGTRELAAQLGLLYERRRRLCGRKAD